MISLEALQAIDSIDRNGSFSAAAEELFKVPSAITYTVKKLEEQLDIKIFDREKQGAKLTPAGKMILDGGRDILQQVHSLEEQAKRVEGGWETTLRVVVDTILPTPPLYPLLCDLQTHHSWLNIQLLDEALSGSWEALVNRRADLVIGVSDEGSGGKQWNKQVLGQITTKLYCGLQHPAAQLSPPIKTEQLASFCHIVVNDSANTLPQRTVGLLGLKQTLQVPTIPHKYQALINHIGISHLPTYLGDQGVKQNLLKELPLQDQQSPQNLFMIWRKNESGRANTWLRENIIKQEIYKEILQAD